LVGSPFWFCDLRAEYQHTNRGCDGKRLLRRHAGRSISETALGLIPRATGGTDYGEVTE